MFISSCTKAVTSSFPQPDTSGDVGVGSSRNNQQQQQQVCNRKAGFMPSPHNSPFSVGKQSYERFVLQESDLCLPFHQQQICPIQLIPNQHLRF
jgi:hypothetical protein